MGKKPGAHQGAKGRLQIFLWGSEFKEDGKKGQSWKTPKNTREVKRGKKKKRTKKTGTAPQPPSEEIWESRKVREPGGTPQQKLEVWGKEEAKDHD